VKLTPAASILVALSLTLGGCAGGDVEVVEEVTESAEESVAADVPRHPLTGFELGGETVSGPSIAVKIDNTADGRPQVGIAAADVVFEELVEGGVTRYLAIFHTAVPDEVGPVRSGRPQDADLVPSFGGVFVFSGVGNSNVREIIRGTGLQLVEHDTSSGTPDGAYFFRSDRKPAPWNLHIEAASLLESYSDLAAPVQQFLFKTAPEEASAFVDGVPAEEISVIFSNGIQSNWEWDAATGTYLKFLGNGSPDVDANGTQISATNLLIFTPNYFDVEGLPSAKVGQTRESAFIATGGKLISGVFDTTEFGAPIKLFYGEDQPVFLTPGKTFILLPPGAGSIAQGVTPGGMDYFSNGEKINLGF
jgi:Protein of unknown function (DUF3048) N-terminal domain/Protein of unknown function (DUF3048) C-terminal domain